MYKGVKKVRPYQLSRKKYAVWDECRRKLGANDASGLDVYFSGASDRIIPAHGEKVNERSRQIIDDSAGRHGVIIPGSAYK